MGDRERRMVFVTVGTTCFDALVKVVDSEEVKQALLQKGYTDLRIQMGRGTYTPSKVTSVSVLHSILFVWFRLVTGGLHLLVNAVFCYQNHST
ncbi:unnamed protein product [Triticum turgidum subsp. durum]|uniref:N-acetylglucosaminyldiphosphodolichol N-acetylglucosaminyltransferase n=1 Tax=Triticum turgidum subsp. durum TaxID=4567 RepID=A0A9R0WF18_TRITD|nr:unnamed protein product [Triticum turgidum subsp. durum]